LAALSFSLFFQVLQTAKSIVESRVTRACEILNAYKGRPGARRILLERGNEDERNELQYATELANRTEKLRKPIRRFAVSTLFLTKNHLILLVFDESYLFQLIVRLCKLI
jgi:hypothetical protein